jgi:hypothetical protein
MGFGIGHGDSVQELEHAGPGFPTEFSRRIQIAVPSAAGNGSLLSTMADFQHTGTQNCENLRSKVPPRNYFTNKR